MVMGMNKKHLVRGVAAAAAATTGAVSAQAADLTYEQAADWTGFYVGASVGYGFSADNIFLDGDDYGLDGGVAGVFGGFNYDLGQIVLGVEAAFHGAAISNNTSTSGNGYDYTVNSITDVKARVGLDLGDFLVYGVGGGSVSTYKTLYYESYSEYGINVGLGIDYKMTDNIVVGVEYLHRIGLKSYDASGYDGYRVDVDTVTLRAAWHF